MTFFKNSLLAGLFLIPFSVLTSCDDNDTPKEAAVGAFFISVTGEADEYLLQAVSLDSGKQTIANNFTQLELTGYTWVFNEDKGKAIGLIYQQGDPGIGLGYEVSPEGKYVPAGEFMVRSRYTSYGFFENYTLAAVSGQTPADANGNAILDENGKPRTDGVTVNFITLDNMAISQKTMLTKNIAGNGEQATFSGIVDMGNGEFLTGLVLSQPRDADATGGSSTGFVTYPDSVWVAAIDANLNVKRIYRDNRLSYSAGRMRSQYYSQIVKGGDGHTYVFSGSYELTATRPSGALRIKSGATGFDSDYYFNIEQYTNGYHFRKVWHITGDYFLIELHNYTHAEIRNMSEADQVVALRLASQYGIVNVKDKTFNWVDGVPTKDNIVNTGLPTANGGKIYFPITAKGAHPTVYVIDPVTKKAEKGLVVTGATAINAVGHLTTK